MTVVLLGDRLSIAVAALTVAGTGAVLGASALKRRRAIARSRATTALLGHLVADLEAGADPATALARAAEETTAAPDITRLVRSAAVHARRGHSPAPVLTGQEELRELAEVGKAWGLAQRHGIPLAGLLRMQGEQITQALRHEAATTASLQGPQATALILSALPLAGIALGSTMGANPVAWLLGGGLGGTLLMAGTALNCAGLLLAHEIIRRARS
ncbi:type II secretion system F family protein [Corynebacterium guangdongense]|nr:type II secretion system F family protein [Corynebacterium guangdongense]